MRYIYNLDIDITMGAVHNHLSVHYEDEGRAKARLKSFADEMKEKTGAPNESNDEWDMYERFNLNCTDTKDGFKAIDDGYDVEFFDYGTIFRVVINGVSYNGSIS